VLVPQVGECACRAAEVGTPRGNQGDAGNLQRRRHRPRQGRGEGVQERLRTKFPKAVEKITSEVDVLLEFYNYPAEHWIHLRTTNPIESTFSTVRLRTKVTKGPGSRMAGLAMAVRPAWAIAWGCESPGGRGGANSESEARASS